MRNPYLYALKLGFTETSVYSLDFLIGALQSIALVGTYIFVWVFVIPQTDGIPLYDRAAYFVLVNGLALVIGGANYRFARDMGNMIKDGALSHYLLRPINPVIMIYVRHLGGRMINIIMGVLFVAGGFFMKPPATLTDLLLFIAMVITATSITASINLIAATFYFKTTEAGGIKNAFSHVTRILNGQMIPMNMFTDVLGGALGKIISFLPFAAISYTPTIMINRMTEQATYQSYVWSSIAWAIILPLFAAYLWKRGLRHYEGTGI